MAQKKAKPRKKAAAKRAAKKPPVTKAGGGAKGPRKKAARRRAAKGSASGANVGFEAQLWQAADKLRGSMDAAEYSVPLNETLSS